MPEQEEIHQNIEKAVHQTIATELGIDLRSIKNDDTFENLGIDSIDMLEISFELEEELEIDIIPSAEVDSWKTVGDAVKYLQNRQRDAK